MSAIQPTQDSIRYARTIEASKRIRWDIDDDVLRGRALDVAQKFLPDGLSLRRTSSASSTPHERRFMSQVQGRTYANIFGLVERFINAKVLEISKRLLVRRPDRARGARALQRRGAQAPGAVPARREARGHEHAAGLHGDARPERRRAASCSASRRGRCSRSRAISRSSPRSTTRRASSRTPSSPSCGRTCSCITGKRSRSTQSWTSSSGGVRTLSSTRRARDRAVTDLIELVGGVDGMLQLQARSDADYFLGVNDRPFTEVEQRSDTRHVLEGLPLAVHCVGRSARSIRGDADLDDHAGAGRADRERARAAHVSVQSAGVLERAPAVAPSPPAARAFRHAAGGTPNSRLNARLNAASDS